jgi:exopolysaccharide production protein ExoZ
VGKQFENLQALRACAAISVVLFHMTFVFWNIPGTAPGGWPLFPMHFVGWAGVDVFFVISGFIIYTVSGRLHWTESNTRTAIEFLLRRVFRVYPIYWVFLLLYTLLVAVGAVAVWNTTWTWDYLGLDFLLVNRYNKQVPVAWSLVYEMLFYVVTSATLLFGRRHYRMILGAWIAVEGVLCTLNHFLPFGTWRDSIWLNPLIIEFGLGCFVGYLVESETTGLWKATAVLWIPLFVAGGYLSAKYNMPGAGDYRVPTFGLGAACLVYAICAAEMVGNVAPQWAIKIGNASYSIYLGQEFSLYSTRYIAFGVGVNTPFAGWVTLLGALLVAVGIGVVSYYLMERPLTTFFHHKIRVTSGRVYWGFVK